MVEQSKIKCLTQCRLSLGWKKYFKHFWASRNKQLSLKFSSQSTCNEVSKNAEIISDGHIHLPTMQ